MSQGALPGFRDFYPEQMAERNYLMKVWRDVAARYGFVEYDGPPLEPLDLYKKKSGDEIVGQLYTFTDKGDREVALRPEMTPTLARMVAAKASSLRKPVRWFSIPQLFRYERQQKGRLREHFQLNVDIVGEISPAADAELLAVAIDVMRGVGLTAADVRARVSDRRLLAAVLLASGVAEGELAGVYGAVDKMGREPRAVTEDKLRAAIRNPDASAKLVSTIDSFRDLDAIGSRFADSPDVLDQVERMREYLRFLAALGVGEWVDFDLSIVRGLAYYTGKVFELFDASGEFRAICGGGRYDDLLSTIGGVDMPALGFGMGDVVLSELLRSRRLFPPLGRGSEYWVAAEDETMLADVMTVAGRLRAKDRSVEYALRSQSLSRQLKQAASAGVESVVMLKRDDYSRGNVTVRTLSDGAERSMTFQSLLDSLR
ncbi:MAG TPA: histidine--tRNA ligase [Gemmatimonadaceae bacterium]|nr:histidine--tRNA ligase [Gemmatimonadaceae bacterium]